MTGPVAVACVIMLWTILQTLGWALIYLPHVPQGFLYSRGLDASGYADFAESLYISLVTLGTLGYGDVVPVDGMLRLLSPLEAITGFALITAAVSWFMQIYPALARRRGLAIWLALLQETGYARKSGGTDPAIGSRVLEELAADIIKIRVDLAQNAETYHFQEAEESMSLPACLPYALDLAERSSRSASADVRFGGELVQGALKELATFLRTQFLARGRTTGEVLASYARDHGYTPAPPDSNRE